MNEFIKDVIIVNNLIGEFKFNQNEAKKVERNFILISNTKIYYCASVYEFGIDINYEIEDQSLEGIDELKDPASYINCANAFMINMKNPELRAYSSSENKKIVLLTGHKDGKVAVWEHDDNFEFQRILENYKHEIIAIIYLKSGIGIVTDDSFIHMWDLHLNSNFKNIDLSNLPFKLYSLT